ncbi:MAG: hypothetical protein R2839_09245 [Thermomicrobiales bacterium]
MAMTKTEAAKLTNDLLLRGVIETIVKESELLARLPLYGGDGHLGHIQPGSDPARRRVLRCR